MVHQPRHYQSTKHQRHNWGRAIIGQYVGDVRPLLNHANKSLINLLTGNIASAMWQLQTGQFEWDLHQDFGKVALNGRWCFQTGGVKNRFDCINIPVHTLIVEKTEITKQIAHEMHLSRLHNYLPKCHVIFLP